MNFFKLYIGDYQRDTAHLSILEHGAYLLMLQHYYATERPLPCGKALHRMLRATEKDEREAIDAVVRQFWAETPDGLVNARADAEITKASTQADTNRRIAVQREEQRKRARTAHEPSTNRVTNDEPNQTPDTRHQKNTEATRGGDETIPPPLEAAVRAPSEAISSPSNPPPIAPTRRGALAVLLRSLGVRCTEAHPTVVEWANGLAVTDDEARAVVELARLHKPPPEQVPIAYLVPILRDLRTAHAPSGIPSAPSDPMLVPRWWDSEKATTEQAQNLGMHPRSGESWDEFRARIRARLRPCEAQSGGTA